MYPQLATSRTEDSLQSSPYFIHARDPSLSELSKFYDYTVLQQLAVMFTVRGEDKALLFPSLFNTAGEVLILSRQSPFFHYNIICHPPRSARLLLPKLSFPPGFFGENFILGAFISGG